MTANKADAQRMDGKEVSKVEATVGGLPEE